MKTIISLRIQQEFLNKLPLCISLLYTLSEFSNYVKVDCVVRINS